MYCHLLGMTCNVCIIAHKIGTEFVMCNNIIITSLCCVRYLTLLSLHTMMGAIL